MKSVGLGDVVVRWIEAYLSGRVSKVNVGARPMHAGTPQGFVIGPLLFLLFLNDLLDGLEALTLLFADDVTMVAQRIQNMNLHSSLTAAWGWSERA